MTQYINSLTLYIMAGVTGITLLIGFLFGLHRGMFRSILRTILLLGCAFGAFAITRWVIITQEPFIEDMVMPFIVSNLGELVELLDASPTLSLYLIDLACALVAPIVYVILFYALKAVTWLIFFIIAIIIPKPKMKNKKKGKGKAKAKAEGGDAQEGQTGGQGGKKKPIVKRGYSPWSRFMGACISTAGAAIIVISLFMPLAGYVDFAESVYVKMDEAGLAEAVDLSAQGIDTEAVLHTTNENIVVSLIKKSGGKYLFDHLTVVGESKDTMGHEVDVVLDMIPAVQKLQNLDFSTIFNTSGSPDLSVIDNDILPILEESSWMQQILSEMMSTAAGKWKNGETFLGVNIKEQLPAEHAGALDGVLNRLSTTSQDRVVSDLHDLTATVGLVSEAFTYMNDVANAGNITSEQLQEKMRDIIMDLTPGSAELLGSALSDEMVGAAGLSEESTSTVKEMITSAITNIANQSQEEREAESDAINALISYTSEDRRDDVSADAIVDTLLSSTVVKDVINEQLTPDEEGKTGQITVTEEQKTAIDNAIENKKAEALENADEETLAFLESLSGFFTVPVLNP